MENDTRAGDSESGIEPFAAGRFIRVLYRYGAWLVGLALLLGLGAIIVTGPPFSEASGSAPLFVRIPLIALWSLPVLALIGPGVVMVRQRRSSLSGWLAVVMAVVLAGLWALV